ncbi:ricin-type beta-trefoil lectin domain protein [Streptomyces formicae]
MLRARIATLAVIATGVGVAFALAAPAGATSTEMPEPGDYRVVNDNRNLCLGYVNNHHKNGEGGNVGSVNAYNCFNKTVSGWDTDWRVTRDDHIEIEGGQNGLTVCLTNTGERFVRVRFCADDEAQEWELDDDHLLRSVTDNRYLAWPSRKGQDVRPYLYSGSPSKLWGKRVYFQPND